MKDPALRPPRNTQLDAAMIHAASSALQEGGFFPW
jgi:hypothetical protein